MDMLPDPYTPVQVDGAYAVRIWTNGKNTALDALTALADAYAAETARPGVQWPVHAFVYGHSSDAPVLVYRDPSRTYTVPTVGDTQRTAMRLARSFGTTGAPYPSSADVLVVAGLRPGYDPNAQPAPAPLGAHLGSGVNVSTGTVWSCSATGNRWTEPGVVITCKPADGPAVHRWAVEAGQHRYTVTDFTAGSTRAVYTALAADRG